MPELRPYRFGVNFCAAVESLEAAEQLDERIVAAIERETGIPTEGGYIEAMADDEVVPDSPLARKLEEARRA